MTQPVPFGKYYLLERINVGGMAEVFKAKAFGVEGFERLVAVKRILPNIAEDEEFITMFIDEAKIAVQLQHANIAQIFDLGKVDDSFFIALEFVHGKDLRAIFDHFRKVGDRMPAAQVCYVMMQVCEGLDYAHNKRDAQGRELGLVHRDVSPQNVLVGYEGEIKLVDFGIAKAAGKASKTQAGILKGKFGYMSPEQVRGLPVDRRSDVFAAGICLYELLTGERLFVGESDFSTLEKVRNVEILPPSSFNRRIAPELERIVLKALAKDAEDRYQNAIDLHDELQAYLYSAGEFFSRKDLAAWMKQTFAGDIAEENARNAQWEQLEQPTPAPVANAGHGMERKARGHGLDWDDEELETQIFDRMPGSSSGEQPRVASGQAGGLEGDDDDEEERPSELSSSDIMLPDVISIDNPYDDKTAIAPPPDEAQLAFDPMPGPSSHDLPMQGGQMGGPQHGGFGPTGPAPGMLGGPMPAPSTTQPFGQTLLGASAPLPPGPPPGLSAYRQTGQMPIPQNTMPWGTPMQAPNNGGGPGYPQQGSPFRQTIMGLPQMSAPYQPPPPPPPQPTYADVQAAAMPRKRFPLGMTLAVLVVALGAMVLYTFYHRQGQLMIEVVPNGAQVAVDGVTLRSLPPFQLDRAPGGYRITAVLEGYSKDERRVEVEPGKTAKVRIELRPSPDTGFELTSDPPGQLVWMDGIPFTGVDAGGPQARTDFKATRVPPGRHLLEIKGDPRFRPWRHEFYQEPGRLISIRASLLPEGMRGGAAAAAAARAAAESASSKPAEVPSPAPSAPKPPAATATVNAKPAGAGGSGSSSVGGAIASAGTATHPATAPVHPATVPAHPAAPAAGGAVATTSPPVSKPATGGASGTSASPTTAPKPADTSKPKVAAKPAEAVTKPAAGGDSAAASGGGQCAITVGSKPWAEVWLDGKNTQKLTPLVDFKLPCGKHKLTLKNPELNAEKTETVTVKPGEKWKKIFPLLDDE